MAGFLFFSTRFFLSFVFLLESRTLEEPCKTDRLDVLDLPQLWTVAIQFLASGSITRWYLGSLASQELLSNEDLADHHVR